MAQGDSYDFSCSGTCEVYEGDEGYIQIDFGVECGLSIVLSEALADRICTALGQLLTDRCLRQHDSLIANAAALPDQVERAELLADAPPPSAADMTEGELILGRRVPSGKLCEYGTWHPDGLCECAAVNSK